MGSGCRLCSSCVLRCTNSLRSTSLHSSSSCVLHCANHLCSTSLHGSSSCVLCCTNHLCSTSRLCCRLCCTNHSRLWHHPSWLHGALRMINSLLNAWAIK